MKTLLFLDDLRNPFEGQWLELFSPLEQPYNTVWLNSYKEFVEWIKINGLPDGICFDHDLGEDEAKQKVSKGISKKKARQEKKEAPTGMDCAKWLVDYCLNNKKKLPLWNVQSSNPCGKDNINGLLNGFLKIQEKEV